MENSEKEMYFSNDSVPFTAKTAEIKSENTVQHLRLSLIDPRSDQPRKSFDEEALASLSLSIVKNGLFQPILVRKSAVGRYQIIAGERRFRACKLAGLKEIPALVLEKDDKKTAEIALIENIQRENLNPIEEAMGYESLAKEYDMTQEELSDQVGKSRSAIANAVRLLDLPDEVLGMVARGEISAGHGRTLLGLKDKNAILPLAKATKDNNYSVRALEDLVKKANRKKRKTKEGENDPQYVDYYRELELKMQSILGRRVQIHGKGPRKSVVLSYENNEDLDDLIKAICGEKYLED